MAATMMTTVGSGARRDLGIGARPPEREPRSSITGEHRFSVDHLIDVAKMMGAPEVATQSADLVARARTFAMLVAGALGLEPEPHILVDGDLEESVISVIVDDARSTRRATVVFRAAEAPYAWLVDVPSVVQRPVNPSLDAPAIVGWVRGS